MASIPRGWASFRESRAKNSGVGKRVMQSVQAAVTVRTERDHLAGGILCLAKGASDTTFLGRHALVMEHTVHHEIPIQTRGVDNDRITALLQTALHRFCACWRERRFPALTVPVVCGV